jgi:CheY-like chemotaxis protein
MNRVKILTSHSFHYKGQQGAIMEHPEEQKQEINIVKLALLVEDYVPCQKIMTHNLDQLGYQVDLAADSLTAIQHIQNKTYDLIIGDINLYGCLSGKNVIQTIRESKLNIDTPLIVWTAYANRNDEEKYLAWGADAALIKACQIKDLKKAIEKCFLKPRYFRKLYYQLKNFKNKLERFINDPEKLKDSEYINQFKCCLHDALITTEEYQHWVDFQQNEV